MLVVNVSVVWELMLLNSITKYSSVLFGVTVNGGLPVKPAFAVKLMLEGLQVAPVMSNDNPLTPFQAPAWR